MMALWKYFGSRSGSQLWLLFVSVILLGVGITGSGHISGTPCGQYLLGRYSLPFFIILATCISLGLLSLAAATLMSQQWADNLAVVSLGLVVGLGMVEIVERTANPLPLVEEFWLTEHPVLGVWYRPNTQFHYGNYRREYRNVFTIDEQGFIVRGNGLARPETDTRIMMIGDSFVAGLEVRPEENMSKRLTEYLAHSNSETGYDVKNFGMPTFSPAKYLLVYRSFEADHDPDWVVVLLFVGNDFSDDASLLHNDRLIFDGGHLLGVTPELNFEERTLWRPRQGYLPLKFRGDRSIWDPRLVDAIWKLFITPICIEREATYSRLISDQDPHDLYLAEIEQQLIRTSWSAIFKNGPLSPEDQDDIGHTFGYLQQLHQEVMADGRKMLLVIIPAEEQLSGEAPETAFIASRRPQKLINEFCQREAFECFDLLPYFETQAVENLYYERDLHFTAYAHDLTAQAIAERILRHHP